jgi:hypothetical protein
MIEEELEALRKAEQRLQECHIKKGELAVKGAKYKYAATGTFNNLHLEYGFEISRRISLFTFSSKKQHSDLLLSEWKSELEALQLKQMYIGIVTPNDQEAERIERLLMGKREKAEVTFHRATSKIALEGDSHIGNDLVLATNEAYLAPALLSRYRLVQYVILCQDNNKMIVVGRKSMSKGDWWSLDGLVREAVADGPLGHLYRAMRQIKFQEFISK